MLRAVLVLLGGALVVACASSKPGGTCDPNDDTCEVDASSTDAPVVDPTDAATDAALKGFGEPCLDKGECTTGICIFVGTGGRCTDLCSAGTCPAEWGCFGVVDIIEPGTVTEVCVPVIDQLCSACTTDNECVQIGQDRCLTYPDGGRFCGRDCRSIACPSGYTCDDQSVGGNVIKQCVPNSGACDCDATNMGTTQPCTIMTPFATTCAGTRTCNGAGGWGSCAPPSTSDDPDGTYADANCDGIDGEVTRGIFVSVAGVDNAACGLLSTSPCATISYGIVRGTTTGRPNVYVQAGTYNEVVRLVNGVNVWGGYSSSWQRNSYSTAGHVVTVTGGLDNGVGGDSEYLTVRAHDLIAQVTIADLILVGPTATGTVGGNGRSSYVVHVDSALLRLERVRIVGGNGADGAVGSVGQDAVIVDRQSYMDGSRGGDGREYNSVCDTSGRGAGGGAGTNTCTQSPSSRAMNGGAGGAGGQMDTSCGPIGLCATGGNCDARPGDNGGNAGHLFGTLGERGYGGPAGIADGTCFVAADPDGNVGRIANGGAGTRTTTIGTIGGGYWYGNGGGDGGTGENGGGGGGGGGAGACDEGTDAYGAGGGGGGAGGCAARGGGGGGGGGGGSFGIFAIGTGTSVGVVDVVVARGNGGRGGDGGRGGRGQSGGLGNGPGNNPGAATAGTGGGGVHGGHGGGGAGGNGGRSVGIATTPGATVSPTNVGYSGGAAGAAGAAGPHAPFAPAAERDGNDGQSGAAGTLDTTRVCTSATSC